MNAKRKAWLAQQQQPLIPGTRLTFGELHASLIHTDLTSYPPEAQQEYARLLAALTGTQRQYQIDVTHSAVNSEVHTTDADGRDVAITFKAPAQAERYSQQLATALRLQGHRVFRTIQS